MAAAAQTAFARVADVFGRVELLVFSVALYTVGTFLRRTFFLQAEASVKEL